MSPAVSRETLFSLLPETKKPWAEFVFSSGAQALAVALLIWVRLLYPSVVTPQEHNFRSIELVSTPVPVNHEPQPVRRLPQPTFVAELQPVNTLRLPAPLPKTPVKVEDESAPTVRLEPEKTHPLLPAPRIPQRGGEVDSFF